MKRKVVTVVVEPKTLFREGLARLLSNTCYGPVRSISSIDDLVDGAPLKGGEALFIIGSSACKEGAGGDRALSKLTQIKQLNPEARLIVLGDAFDARDVVAALRAGANGYILNTTRSEALIKSLDLVMFGNTVLPSEFSRAVREHQSASTEIAVSSAMPEFMLGADPMEMPRQFDLGIDPRKLSSRETAILSCLTLGESNKSIARRVGITEATVKTHIKAILRKIRVRNRTQAALWALNNLQPGAPEVALQNGHQQASAPN
jgi:two-component system nitrate/nitrite response regulator NarL